MSPRAAGSDENRRKKRIPMRVPVELKIRQISSDTIFRRSDKKVEGHVVNLSDTGMQLSADQIFGPDAVFRARIAFESKHPRIEASLSVKWARKNAFKAFGDYSYGIHFDKIDDEAKELLMRIYDEEKAKYDDKAGAKK